MCDPTRVLRRSCRLVPPNISGPGPVHPEASERFGSPHREGQLPQITSEFSTVPAASGRKPSDWQTFGADDTPPMTFRFSSVLRVGRLRRALLGQSCQAPKGLATVALEAVVFQWRVPDCGRSAGRVLEVAAGTGLIWLAYHGVQPGRTKDGRNGRPATRIQRRLT